MLDVCVSRRAKGPRPAAGPPTGVVVKVIFVLLLVCEVRHCRVVSREVRRGDLSGGGDEPCLSASRNHHDIFPYDMTYQSNDDYLRRPCEEQTPAIQQSRLENSAYLFMKTMRQRKKRYTTCKYVTLCHFKMCNVGRKRTTRYFHLIKSLM